MERTKRRGKPFLEIFASTLQQDYRFPILELFAFLYTLGTFIFVSFQTYGGITDEQAAYMVVTSLMGFPMFIFTILIFKNVAYGLGNDLEKGTIQTLFSYPLKRRLILTAKLLSAVAVALLLFLGIQISALYLLAPDIVSNYIGTVLLTYSANVGYPLLLTAVLLLMTLKVKRGGLGLVFGIILYFAVGVITGILTVIAFVTDSAWPIQTIAVINPTITLQQYYFQAGLVGSWTPSFNEVLLYLSGSYVIVAVLFFLSYVYFCRRLSL